MLSLIFLVFRTMESSLKNIFSLTLWFCLTFFLGACGRELQDLAKEIKEMKTSIQNQSIFYGEYLIRPALPQTSGFNKEVNIDTRVNGVHQNAVDTNRVNHYAIYNTEEGLYHGVEALVEIYAYFSVDANQMSSSLIWVVNGVNDNFNSVQAGWHIYPGFYGDNETHFFTFWTVDGYQNTGCYNLNCPGFVLDKSTVIKPGDVMRSANIGLKIFQDQQTGDWRLYGYGSPIGHWPKNLFSTLANGASHVSLGGMISFIHNEKSPPMGDGNFPNAGEKQAALMQHIKLVDDKGQDQYPNPDDFVPYQDKDSCYKVDAIADSNRHEGYFFSYGGPGGCTD